MGQGISVYEKQNWQLLTDGVISTSNPDTTNLEEITFRTFSSSKGVGEGGFVVPGITFATTFWFILISVLVQKRYKIL